jgi:hypothetical protein
VLSYQPADLALGIIGRDKPIVARFNLNTQNAAIDFKVVISELRTPERKFYMYASVYFQALHTLESKTGWETGLHMTCGEELAKHADELNRKRGFMKNESCANMIQDGIMLQVQFSLKNNASVRIANDSVEGDVLLNNATQFILDCSDKYRDGYEYEGPNPAGYTEAISRVRDENDDMYLVYSEEILFLAGITSVKTWLIYMLWPQWLQESGLDMDVMELIGDLARVTTLYGSMWFYKMQLQSLGFGVQDIDPQYLTMVQYKDLLKPWWLERRWGPGWAIAWASFSAPLSLPTSSVYWMTCLGLARDNIEQSRMIAEISGVFAG